MWFIVLLFCIIHISDFTDQVIMKFVTHVESSALSFPSG